MWESDFIWVINHLFGISEKDFYLMFSIPFECCQFRNEPVWYISDNSEGEFCFKLRQLWTKFPEERSHLRDFIERWKSEKPTIRKAFDDLWVYTHLLIKDEDFGFFIVPHNPVRNRCEHCGSHLVSGICNECGRAHDYGSLLFRAGLGR